MCADFVSPQPSFAPPPDVLGAYLRGQMAPIQQAGAMQQIAQSRQAVAESQQTMSLLVWAQVLGDAAVRLQGAGVDQLPAGHRLQ